MTVSGELVVAGGDGAMLLEAGEEPFDPVALAMGSAVEVALWGFGAPAGDDGADAAAAQLLADRVAAVALWQQHSWRTTATVVGSPSEEVACALDKIGPH